MAVWGRQRDAECAAVLLLLSQIPAGLYERNCRLTCVVDGHFRDAETFGCVVRTSNNDVAKLLRQRSAVNGDVLTGSDWAVVPSTERVWVSADCWTLGREVIRQTDVKVVQTTYYTAVQAEVFSSRPTDVFILHLLRFKLFVYSCYYLLYVHVLYYLRIQHKRRTW